MLSSFFFVGCVYIYNLSNKKVCVYNKKVYVYVCMGGGCLDKYISFATWPPQTKIPGSALGCWTPLILIIMLWKCSVILKFVF